MGVSHNVRVYVTPKVLSKLERLRWKAEARYFCNGPRETEGKSSYADLRR